MYQQCTFTLSNDRLNSRRRVMVISGWLLQGTNLISTSITPRSLMASLFSPTMHSFFRKVTAKINRSSNLRPAAGKKGERGRKGRD